jgi:hypothetical protein
MPTRDQNIGCTQGDSFTFAITILPYPDNTVPDLTAATAQWVMQEGNYTDAAVLVVKNAPPHIYISQDEAANWQVVVGPDPEDTANLPRGMYYHQCRVALANGEVSHVEGGAFLLGFSGIP